MEKLKPKLFSVMKTYSKKQFIQDITAGVIVAIIALPLSIALALASGVRPEQGLYTAIVAGFVISFLGGSRVQISGPTAAFATIVAGIVAKNGMDGLILATLMAGVLLIMMGLLRMGSLIKYIPYTITTGFTSGIAVTIVIGQVKDFMGLTFTESPVETLEKVVEIFKSITTVNWQAIVVGVVCLGVLIVWPKLSRKIPGSLIAVLVGIGMVKILKMEVNTIGTLYEISAKPPAFQLPHFSLELARTVMPDAFTIAILAAIESLLSCVVSDGMVGSHHRSNMELIAQGCGNMASACFGGIPATGAIARTAANVKNGGRTPIAGMVHAIVLLLILVILMPYAAWIPMPAIAAILFMVAYNMSEWREFVALCKSSPKSDIAVLLVTFVFTVVFDLVIAIEIGLFLAGVLFMKRMADVTHVEGWNYVDEDDMGHDEHALGLKVVPKNTMVFEIIGPMFFGAAEKFVNFPVRKGVNAMILRMRGVPSVDATAVRSMKKVLEVCQKNGVTLILSHVQEQPMHALKKAGLIEQIGEENICANIDAAIERAKELE